MFRCRKSRHIPVVPRPIMDEVEVETVDSNGVINVSYAEVTNESLANKLPAYSDYQLSNLLAANVPLQPVNAQVLDSVPTDDQMLHALDELERLDDPESKVEPSNND